MNLTSRSLTTDSTGSPVLSKAVIWLSKQLWLGCVSKVEIELPDGDVMIVGQTKLNAPTPRIRLFRPGKVLRKSARGLMGWAEAYMAGDWDTPCLKTVLAWGGINESALESAFNSSWLSRKKNRFLHLSNHNSRRGSRKNITAHYDHGNDFYQLWLDSNMTYSSAIFQEDNETLEQAQSNKYLSILDLLDIEPQHSVLEIGCGWGSFARNLSKKPHESYHGITLSKEQLIYATAAASEMGMNPDQYHFEQKDYRDLKEQYDRIVSIEMFEAIGESQWQGYFQKLGQCLKPGGVAVIQVISIDDKRFANYRKSADFIQKYIFPGGMLPSHSLMIEQIHNSGLKLEKSRAFGKDYARTIQHWSERFNNAWPQIEKLGFNQRFRRMWNFYLHYCETGFLKDSINVRLYRIRKPEVHG